MHLKRLPVSEIKVDRSFVQRMTSDADDAAIVRSIVDLAHSLGLRVVAEGVETIETLAGPGGARLRPGPGLPDQPAGAGRRGRPAGWPRTSRPARVQAPAGVAQAAPEALAARP